MSLLSKLFGARSAANDAGPDPQIYDGFTIFPEPIKEPGGFRIAARIEKEIAGELKSHMMIRADVIGSKEAATAESLRKAKIFIDQMGDRLFRSV
ncbi:hypothetical protein K3X13_08080 [Aliiroseovarius crassostreae]|uniref:Uncharacterized protein n=1 Tax=Aliiroseovarius crassostreae TaxID=154981 RepID=A0A9Q9H7S1_9RHOB|nr:HlyU family transcriptional regulator [Aliiroseovarius crassostreae]UWP91064.1 hypothetical protein K3X13_08080 [Aliiroseovarius crassostreae]UWP94251.1 hypothetical protein K3X48_08255 [Aliiroseovarius crassostreae]